MLRPFLQPLFFLALLMRLHLGPAAHEGEVPRWLAVLDAATRVPVPQAVVQPIIAVDIPRLRLRSVHAVEAEALELLQDLVPRVQDCRCGEPGSARHARVFRNGALEIDEARTVQYGLQRLLVLVFQRPDSRLAEPGAVCE